MSVDKAKEYYRGSNGVKKLNCAQAVIGAFKERCAIDDTALALFASCGGGRAPEGQCGALYAAKYILQDRNDGSIEACENIFRTHAGSTKCKEIRGLKKLPCPGCVEKAAEFIDTIYRNDEKSGIMSLSKMEGFSMDSIVKQFAAGSCYSYIISSGKEAIIVDPHISLADDYDAYLKKQTLTLQYIIDTHTHADHFSLAAVLKKKYNVPIVMGEKAVSQVADKRVTDGDTLAFGSSKCTVIYTPGHTDDAISIYTGKAVFTGDVLMIESVGRSDFQNGSPESMFDSLQKLKALPGTTILYPGHDYHNKLVSAIAHEKETNPFLKETDKVKFAADMRAKVLAKPFNMDNIIRVNQKGEAVSLEMISDKQAQAIIGSGTRVKLIDVRSPLEFSEAHIKGSINIPIDMLTLKAAELKAEENTYIVLCRTGTRSAMAADMLIQSGIPSVKVMNGGMTQWQKDHLPVIKGEGGISLERQVRVGAGAFVVIGILLSWFVNPAFIAIPLFVGCGLVYAGITDNCMMGMLLMKLPYNKNLYKAKHGGGTCSMS